MIRIVSAALALAFLTAPAAAEVVERSADHFVLRYESITEGPMEDLPGVVGEVPRWWIRPIPTAAKPATCRSARR